MLSGGATKESWNFHGLVGLQLTGSKLDFYVERLPAAEPGWQGAQRRDSARSVSFYRGNSGLHRVVDFFPVEDLARFVSRVISQRERLPDFRGWHHRCACDTQLLSRDGRPKVATTGNLSVMAALSPTRAWYRRRLRSLVLPPPRRPSPKRRCVVTCSGDGSRVVVECPVNQFLWAESECR